MAADSRTYIAIDLKSFYASVECVERGVNPLTTHLVVADRSRTNKTICLAVSPSLKSYGVPGRPRLFEVVQIVDSLNRHRRADIPGGEFTGKSCDIDVLDAHTDVEIDYLVAPPRMALYLQYSTDIYNIYLKYVSPEDIYVYSIDEVFIDATDYLTLYGLSAHDFAMKLVKDVLRGTGITATAGIGTNMYLCKVAMDIVAKHIPADKDGVRIAQLDEMTYRRKLWDYRPITKFWRVGRGISNTLAKYGIDTMGKIARCSLENEELLYKLFGVNAELLIDHAWGWEPCTMKDVKAYRPEGNSVSNGQVLTEAYSYEHARIVIQEMAEAAALSIFAKHLVTDHVVVAVGYDTKSMTVIEDDVIDKSVIKRDHYGRKVPKHAHGSSHLEERTSSARIIANAALDIFDRCVDRRLLIRRLNVTLCNVVNENMITSMPMQTELDLFTDYDALEAEKAEKAKADIRERNMQAALVNIKKKFGKNAILKGLNFREGSTARSRNRQIGGHKA